MVLVSKVSDKHTDSTHFVSTAFQHCKNFKVKNPVSQPESEIKVKKQTQGKFLKIRNMATRDVPHEK